MLQPGFEPGARPREGREFVQATPLELSGLGEQVTARGTGRTDRSRRLREGRKTGLPEPEHASLPLQGGVVTAGPQGDSLRLVVCRYDCTTADDSTAAAHRRGGRTSGHPGMSIGPWRLQTLPGPACHPRFTRGRWLPPSMDIPLGSRITRVPRLPSRSCDGPRKRRRRDLNPGHGRDRAACYAELHHVGIRGR